MIHTKESMAASIRQNLLLGLITLAPLVLTLWVFIAIVNFLDGAIYAVLPITIHIPGLGLIVAFVLILGAGAIARTYFGKFLNHLFDSMMSKVPVVRGLYSSAKQISGAFFSADAKSTFKRVVLVPFPSATSRSIGFLAGTFTPTESLVFIPTAPNPTSGYVLVFKNDQLEDAHMEVDEAFRTIVSCGFLSKHGETPHG